MHKNLEAEKVLLYQKLYDFAKAEQEKQDKQQKKQKQKMSLELPTPLQQEFFSFLDKINLLLMEEREDFYSYFLLQMNRQLDCSLASPTGVNFKQGKFVLYINPLQYLTLEIEQMLTCLEHEVLHIISLHLQRAREFSKDYNPLAINLAMDVTVNNYLQYLPPDAIDLPWVNRQFDLYLKPYETLEYYVEALNKELKTKKLSDIITPADEKEFTGFPLNFSPETAHDLWLDSDAIDNNTLHQLLERQIEKATRGKLEGRVGNLVAALKKQAHELPWHWYLRKIVGQMPADYKRTMARRSRRQPERIELPGRLRQHQARVAIALDISGSISDAEFKQAMKEVMAIVRVYKQEAVVIECDSEVRRVYKVRTIHDIKERLKERGGTKYQPVIEFVNKGHFELLVYFTDGKGEERLTVEPQGYRILWILSGKGEHLSLQKDYGVIKKLKPVQEVENILDYNDVERGGFSMNAQEGYFLSGD